MIRMTARRLNLGSSFIQFMTKALNKRSDKFGDMSVEPEVVIDKTGSMFQAEIKYTFLKKRLFASATATNAKTAFLRAMDKIRRQFEKTHERHSDHMAEKDLEKIPQ